MLLLPIQRCHLLPLYQQFEYIGLYHSTILKAIIMPLVLRQQPWLSKSCLWLERDNFLFVSPQLYYNSALDYMLYIPSTETCGEFYAFKCACHCLTLHQTYVKKELLAFVVFFANILSPVIFFANIYPKYYSVAIVQKATTEG